jgi:hypothetical protein
MRGPREQAQGKCPGNELAGAGLVVDAQTVIMMGLDLVAAAAVGEVSMPCKRFLKTKYECHAHCVICQWPGDDVFWLLLSDLESKSLSTQALFPP